VIKSRRMGLAGQVGRMGGDEGGGGETRGKETTWESQA
jgi:hypothetical protein